MAPTYLTDDQIFLDDSQVFGGSQGPQYLDDSQVFLNDSQVFGQPSPAHVDPRKDAYARQLSRGDSALGSFAQGLFDVGASLVEAPGIAGSALGWSEGDPREGIGGKAASAIRSFGKSYFPTNPQYSGEFLTSTLPQAAGSMLGFVGPGIAANSVATAFKLAPKAAAILAGGTASVAGAATGASSGFHDALENGASIETAYKSAGLNALIGTSEGVPITHFLDRLDTATGGTVRRVITDMLKQGTEEAAQEAFQSITSNAVAQNLYDENRGLFEGAGEGAAAGGVLGGFMGMLAGFAGVHRARGGVRPEDVQLSEDDQNSPIPDDVLKEGRAAMENADRGIPAGAVPADQLLGEVDEDPTDGQSGILGSSGGDGRGGGSASVGPVEAAAIGDGIAAGGSAEAGARPVDRADALGTVGDQEGGLSPATPPRLKTPEAESAFAEATQRAADILQSAGYADDQKAARRERQEASRIVQEARAAYDVAPFADEAGSAADEAPSLSFTTEKGSVYQSFGDGTTIRDKAARNDPGHEGDQGIKPRSTKTIYVDENAAVLSAAGLQGLGSKGARVVFRNGKVSLATWNEKAGKWGISPGSRDIPFHTEPAVGRYPLELWNPKDDTPASEAYGGMHAGNKIVSISGTAETGQTQSDAYTQMPGDRERIQPDMFGGPDRSERNLALRERARAYADEAMSKDPAGAVDALTKQAERIAASSRQSDRKRDDIAAYRLAARMDAAGASPVVPTVEPMPDMTVKGKSSGASADAISDPDVTAAIVQTEADNAAAEPTEAQKEAGNYKMGHVKIGPLDISIENARGSERTGIDRDGEKWSVTMPAHYGYVRGTEGADGDHVDVYVGDSVASPTIYVVDQVDADTGKFDEHKAMLGFASRDEAMRAYDAGFSDGRGPDRRGGVTEMDVEAFKDWAKNGDTTKALTDLGGRGEAAPVASDETSASTETTAAPALRIEDYTEKSIIVRGKTKENIDRIKGIPGRKPLWNKKAQGWVFPKTREGQVREALADLIEPTQSTDQAPEKGKRRTEKSTDTLGDLMEAAGVALPSRRLAKNDTTGLESQSQRMTPPEGIDWDNFTPDMIPESHYRAVIERYSSGAGGDVDLQAIAKDMGADKYKPNTVSGKVVEEVAEAVLSKRWRDSGISFEQAVKAYEDQPKLGTRTGSSSAQQAYSTPIPIAVHLSDILGIGGKGVAVLEPTAGTGLLVQGDKSRAATLNEIDPVRAALLRAQGYEPTTVDATSPSLAGGPFDVVIANPPFGAVKNERGKSMAFVVMDPATREPIWRGTAIDHAIALNALMRLKPGGIAGLIIGGPHPKSIKEDADPERSAHYQSKAKFWTPLLERFEITSMVTLDGSLYKKQGAAWPVDVLVLRRRDAQIDKATAVAESPANNLPEVARTWSDARSELVRPDAGRSQLSGGQVDQSPENVRGKEGVDLRSDANRAESQSGMEGGGRNTGGSRDTERDAGDAREVRDGGVRERSDVRRDDAEGGGQRVSQGERERGEQSGQPAAGDVATKPDAGRQSVTQKTKKASEPSEGQRAYKPASKRQTLDTLTPASLSDPIERSLEKLKSKVGDIDEFVARELGYTSLEETILSAEQVDSVALAIDAAKNGTGLVIGDQTGVGKGVQVASMIRWAHRNGMTPIFMTEKPALYLDMLFRDLADIGGLDGVLVDKIKAFPTNSKFDGKTSISGSGGVLRVPAGHAKIMKEMTENRDSGDWDIIVTTYDQANTTRGQKGDRHRLIEALAPNAFFILDESHNAGGTGITWEDVAEMRASGKEVLPRELLIREWLKSARAALFSSATWAKRPQTMSLYATRTDLELAVPGVSIDKMFERGGIPMQQAVAAMMAKNGQYIRREKSFEGIEFREQEVNVPNDVADKVSAALRDLVMVDKEIFSEVRTRHRRENGGDRDSGNAEDQVDSAEFTSVMATVLDQIYSAMKAGEVAKSAIAELQEGRKPVIAFDNTLGSIFEEMVKTGQAAVGKPIPFGVDDLMSKYLERRLSYSVTDPLTKDTDRVRIPLSYLLPEERAAFEQMKTQISEDLDIGMRGSPIDAVIEELEAAGYTVGEITGRKYRVNYRSGKLEARKGSGDPAQRAATTADFNNGKLDALILNRSAATGVSMHASERFDDQSPRTMILAQFEKNIDTFVQLLGRINRTGQVALPRYIIPDSNIPAENRLLAVLKSKLTSLQANMTGSGKGQVSISVPDLITKEGSIAASKVLAENPAMADAMGLEPQPASTINDGTLARRATGRVALLPIEDQEAFYSALIGEYEDEVKRQRDAGNQVGAAEKQDLDAIPKRSMVYKIADGPSEFQGEVVAVEADVKLLTKPPSIESTDLEIKTIDPDGAKYAADLSRYSDVLKERFKKLSDGISSLRGDEEKARASGKLKEGDAIRREHHEASLSLEKFRKEANASFFAMKNMKPGSFFFIDTPDGQAMARLLSWQRSTRTKDDASPSAWVATIAVASPRPPRMVASAASLARLSPRVEPQAIGRREFEKQTEAMKGGRENRVVLVGNIPRAMALAPPKSSIIQFTDNKGVTGEGVLLPPSVKSLSGAEVSALEFEQASKAVEFVSNSGAEIGIGTAEDGKVDDVQVRLKNDGGKYVAIVSKKSKSFATNKSVRDAIAPSQFVVYAGAWRTTLDAAKAEAWINAAYRIGGRLSPLNQQDRARSIQGVASAGAQSVRMDESRGLFEQVAGSSKGEKKYSRRTRGPVKEEVLPRILDKLDARVKALGISGRVSVKFRAEIDGGRADASAIGNLIEIAIGAKDKIGALNHEVIHLLKNLDLFTRLEWGALERRAASDAKKLARIREDYADLNLSEPEILEEVIAEQYREWADGRAKPGGMMRKAFERVRNFIRAVRQALRGEGFTTAEDIFEKIEKGEVGRRNGGKDVRTGDPFMMRSGDRVKEALSGLSLRQPVDRAFRIPFDLFGGMDERGRWNPSKNLFDKAERVIVDAKFDDTGRFAWANSLLHSARAGLIDRYGLDSEYVERDRKRGLEQAAMTKEAQAILSSLKDAGVGIKEAKALQAILTGEKVDAKDLESMAAPIREAIDQMGAEAVQLGLLSQEAYERNKGKYLHRVYTKHEADQSRLSSWFTRYMTGRRKRIIGDQFKGRGLWVKVPADRLGKDHDIKAEMGERVQVFDLMSKSGSKVRKRIYAPVGTKVPDGYRDSGVWEIRAIDGKGTPTIWRDFTKEERVKMGEIVDARYTIAKTFMQMAADLSTGRFFRDIAQNEDWSVEKIPDNASWKNASEFARFWDDGSIEWVKVPDTVIPKSNTKRYGKLAGRYVRAEIWRDMAELEAMQKPGLWSTLLTQWKLNKALALDTPIPTPSGWTTMGDVVVGDVLFDEKGQQCKVLEVKEIQCGRPCYRVVFSDRTSIVADDDHLWMTNHRNMGEGVRTTREIRESLTINYRGDAAHSIPVAGAINTPDADLPIHPYAIGLWLGDGHSNAPVVTLNDDHVPEITNKLSSIGIHFGKLRKDPRSKAVSLTVNTECVTRDGSPNKFKLALVASGLLGNKHIPQAYLRASSSQRLSLLQGLMDSDGWIASKGECGFGTSSSDLHKGVMELLRSLGFKPMSREFISASGSPAWRIYFKAYAGDEVSTLDSKKCRLRDRPLRQQRSSTRQIVSVEPVDSVPVRCIAVSSNSHLFLAGEGMVPTHNTARSPVTHMNNIMSNFMLMDMADVSMTDLVDGIRAMVGKSSDFEEAQKNGAFGSDMIAQEMRENILKPLLKEIQAQGQGGGFLEARIGTLGKVLDRVWSFAQKADQKMRDAYQLEDELFRMATYMRERRHGASPEEAARHARDQFLDYDIRAPWVNAARRTVLPFIAYSYRATPIIAKSIAYRPWKLAKYITVAYAMNALAYMVVGDDDEDEERRSLREEEQGYTWLGAPRMQRLPWNDENGNPVFLDIRRWIPAGDVFDMNQGQSVLPIPAPLQFGGPLMLAAEAMLNKQAFTGREIVNTEIDDPWEKTSKVGDWLWKSWMPSAAYIPGSWYWEKIGNAIAGARDWQGRPYDVTQSALSSVGIKVKPQDVRDGMAAHARRFDFLEREIKSSITRLKKDRGRGMISDSEFDSALDRALGKLRDLNEKRRETFIGDE